MAPPPTPPCTRTPPGEAAPGSELTAAPLPGPPPGRGTRGRGAGAGPPSRQTVQAQERPRPEARPESPVPAAQERPRPDPHPHPPQRTPEEPRRLQTPGLTHRLTQARSQARPSLHNLTLLHTPLYLSLHLTFSLQSCRHI